MAGTWGASSPRLVDRSYSSIRFGRIWRSSIDMSVSYLLNTCARRLANQRVNRVGQLPGDLRVHLHIDCVHGSAGNHHAVVMEASALTSMGSLARDEIEIVSVGLNATTLTSRSARFGMAWSDRESLNRP